MYALLELFYPQTCASCTAFLGHGEKIVCTTCRHSFPIAHEHLKQELVIHNLLKGRVNIELATALFYFDKKGRVQQLIHNLKYKRKQKISKFLGLWLGLELAEDKNWETIDCIIPVPLHPLRKHKRGYNQVAGFGKAIAKQLNKPYNDKILFRKRMTKTQVFKNRYSRSDIIAGSFAIKNTDELMGLHILLVDDLITTGSTLEACSKALEQIPHIKLSIAVMAIAN